MARGAITVLSLCGLVATDLGLDTSRIDMKSSVAKTVKAARRGEDDADVRLEDLFMMMERRYNLPTLSRKDRAFCANLSYGQLSEYLPLLRLMAY
jgi:hypothetical protein